MRKATGAGQRRAAARRSKHARAHSALIRQASQLRLRLQRCSYPRSFCSAAQQVVPVSVAQLFGCSKGSP